MKKSLLFLFLLSHFSAQSQIVLQGIVLDSTTKEPMPFVNVAVKGTSTGTSTAMNGKFILDANQIPCTLVFSFVGHEKKEVVFNSTKTQKIYLSDKGIDLTEAIVLAGPNPAERIMSKVIKNSELNNPEKNCQFSYLSYNKLLFTIGMDSTALSEKINSTTLSKDEKEMFDFFNKQYLFLTESVSERKFAGVNKDKETILASKVSGFNSPVFTLLSTQLQSFHFYKEEVSLSDVKYVGPVSNHGLQHYYFKLLDTFYLDKDTVYAISFNPKKENDLHSMMGVLQIHTDGYAIYNVIAEPAQQQETGFGIKVSQQYKKIENKQWFPSELNTRIIFYGSKIRDYPMIGIGSGIVKEIKLNPEFTKADFDEVEIALGKNLEKNSAQVFKEYRDDSLSQKEIETYRVIDSIGGAHHFDTKVLVVQSLANGCVPVKFLDWDLSQLLNYNDYEGLRLGSGLRTNHKISKWFSLGGYGAYGFDDKALKYGADLKVFLHKKNQVEFNFSYKKDIEAASGLSFFNAQRSLFAQGYSAFFINRFDSLTKYEARFSFRALEHFKFHLFGNYQQRQSFGNYMFRFPLSDEVALLDQTFTLAETGIEMRLAINEKFIETPFGFISKGTKWPIVMLRYTKGLSGIRGSEYDYDRIILKADKTFSSLRWGTTTASISSGLVKGETPYHLLFNPAGTYRPIKKMTVYSMDGFETMRVNEFLFDRFASAHLRYRFAKPLVNGKKFKPYLSFSTAFLWGKFENPQIHQNLAFSVIDKPYTESGIIFDNLLRSGISGIGIGAFYRWGNHQLPAFKENMAIKISLSLALG